MASDRLLDALYVAELVKWLLSGDHLPPRAGKDGCTAGCFGGVGAGRGGTGPLITSKSKREVGIKGSWVDDRGPLQHQAIFEDNHGQETRKPPGWAALGSCYGRTILGRRRIPTVPKSPCG
jgi:hypothetical protein